jgi:glutamyl-tRNA reductase
MKTHDTLPEIALVGMSHKTASVDMRECFSVPEERIPSFLASVRSAGIDEAVYVSTCNRVEIYFAARDIPGGVRHVMGLLEEISSMRCEEFEASIYRKYGRDAAHHLLSVASSLDSMVVGENEILGQVKKSYARSVQDGTSGVILNRLFHQAFHTAKRVRTETEIAKNPLSIAYIATELPQIFENLTERRALLPGRGRWGDLS